MNKEGEKKCEYEYLQKIEEEINLVAKTELSSNYLSRLVHKKDYKIAKKLGEEAVEVVIEAVSGKDSKFIEENADLLLHMLVLLNNKGYSLSDVLKSMKKKLKKRD